MAGLQSFARNSDQNPQAVAWSCHGRVRTFSLPGSRPEKCGRPIKIRWGEAKLRSTRRRYWIYFLLFLFSAIAYVDRVNMSVAGKPIAQELGLSPVVLGYLFSSFLWAYVLMMLPGGRLIDRWGAHLIAGVSTAVWSIAQMATGASVGVVTMLLTRLGLGIGEAPFSPIVYRSVRAWAPYTERGTATAVIGAGGSLGPALGAPLVAWLIQVLSWRWSFVVTGAIGFVWLAVWVASVSTPEKTNWLPEPERQRILTEREAGIEPPDHGGVGYLVLLRCPAMWGLAISQGCLVYSLYLYLSWLPNTCRPRVICPWSNRGSTPLFRFSLPPQ
jgi:MFS family permease